MGKFIRIWIFGSTLLLVSGPPAYSQVFSFGVKAGIPLTSPYTTEQVPDGGASASELRFTVGPTIEVHLPFHLSVEADALWRQSSFSWGGGSINPVYASVNDWQVPLLVKYEGKVGPLHPFIDGGVVYRHVSIGGAPPPTNPNMAGVTVGGGGMLKVWHLRLSPELRYTRWPTAAFSQAYPGFVISQSNQLDLLVGFTF
jgi:hypothetical protein